MKALADAEGVKLRVSYRVNGFFGELYRIGASEPIEWIDPDTDEVKQCKLSSNYLKCLTSSVSKHINSQGETPNFLASC